MAKREIRNLTLAAMFLAIGLVLPLLFGQIPEIGQRLLAMHIPVLLCGLICGKKFGFAVGLILPLLRFAIFGIPPIVPMGIAMSLELATYGFVIGWLYHSSKWQCIVALYRSMIIAMIAGRAVFIPVWMIVTGISGTGVNTWAFAFTSAFITALPGILLQLVLIPAIMIALDKTGAFPFKSRHHKEQQPLSE